MCEVAEAKSISILDLLQSRLNLTSFSANTVKRLLMMAMKGQARNKEEESGQMLRANESTSAVSHFEACPCWMGPLTPLECAFVVSQTHVQHTHTPNRVVILSKLDTMQIHYNTLGHLFLSLSLTPVVFLFGG